ncbi:hypothetical protein ACFL6H_04795 [Candidatus Latescibacterota bacterium]
MFTQEEVEEMVREAVEKTEKSFGGTFKRLKSENEELIAQHETALAERDSARDQLENTVKEYEQKFSENKKTISEFAIKSELEKQFREKGVLPEQFVDPGSIEYSDDPEILSSNVAKEIEKGRKSLEKVLQDIGITASGSIQATVNPTNPPSRDTKTAHDLKTAVSKEVLSDMRERGLIR